MKIKKKIKIPTIFGLTLLLIALALGVVVFYYQEDINQKKLAAFSPKNIALVNVTDKSAAITWQTDTKVIGEVIYGPDNNLEKTQSDDRDLNKSFSSRLTHFVTLKNLKSNTKYYYKIKSKNFTYPETIQEFITSPQINTQAANQLLKPIIGTIVDTSLEPIDESVIFLKINGASTLASFSTHVGNFIIPLKNLLTSDLKQPFAFENNIDATLEIRRGNQQSIVDITIPLKDKTLTAIQMGRNINLKEYIVSSSAQLKSQPKIDPKLKFDLNGDKKINSVDLSIVTQNFGKNPKIKEADFNRDGIVNQKDIELVKKALPQ